MAELHIAADAGRLEEVLSFIQEQLDANDSPMQVTTQLLIAVEEIFVNIGYYAYAPGTGDATITCEIDGEPKKAVITFIDSGTPYNPLEKEDPDITLAADDRKIGGLGIYMVKQTMDDMQYEYSDGKNILRLYKTLVAPPRRQRARRTEE